jgi:hypothetical protein
MNATLALMVDAALLMGLLVRSSLHILLEKLMNNFLGISDAYYCAECTRLEKDRDGCPKIVNLGASRTDLFYERRRLGVYSYVSLKTPRADVFIGFKKG